MGTELTEHATPCTTVNAVGALFVRMRDFEKDLCVIRAYAKAGRFRRGGHH